MEQALLKVFVFLSAIVGAVATYIHLTRHLNPPKPQGSLEAKDEERAREKKWAKLMAVMMVLIVVISFVAAILCT